MTPSIDIDRALAEIERRAQREDVLVWSEKYRREFSCVCITRDTLRDVLTKLLRERDQVVEIARSIRAEGVISYGGWDSCRVVINPREWNRLGDALAALAAPAERNSGEKRDA